MFNLYMAPFSMDLVNCVLFEMSREATRKCTTFEASRKATRKKLYGVLTTIYVDGDEVYDLPVISMCSIFGFVSLHGLKIVTVKMCSFAFAITVFVRRLNLYVVFMSFASDMQLKISCFSL